MSNKISVIVPVYNVEKYLDECVASICGQTYSDLEIFLVDDGSTDGSGAVCDKWKEADARIVVIHQENGGISAARNAGLKMAKGEYLAFVDSDDKLAPDMYEKLMADMVKNDSDIAVCAYQVIEEDGRERPARVEDMAAGVYTPEQIVCGLYGNLRIRTAMVLANNKLYRKEIFEGVEYPVGKVHEDEYLIHELLLKVQRISVIRDRLYFYRIRSGSIMRSETIVKKSFLFYALKRRLEDCAAAGFQESTIRLIAENCIDTGIRFWLKLTGNRLLPGEELDDYYRDVLEVMRKYGRWGSGKQRLVWRMFAGCPRLLLWWYTKCKSLKRK
ncbi:MAG: glycosyltransferase [Acetatifactor sp.]